MFTRRNLLKMMAAAAAALPFTERRAMASFLFFRPRKSSPPRMVENRFVRDGRALVGISGAGTVEEKIEEAVSLIGGFDKLDVKGRSVLVKPNVVSGEANPSTTNPEVVSAVVRLLKREGASKVYVGDMSAMMTLSTTRNMRSSGIAAAAEGEGAEVVAFEDYEWDEVSLPDNDIVKTAYVTEWLYRVDRIVNLPVVKTHHSATYTISLKNFIGCTHLKQRPYLIDSSKWEEIISEFNAAYAPEINIVDATVSMVEGGPWRGTPRETGAIIASGDRVGADAAGLGIIRHFDLSEPVTSIGVWDQRQIKRAVELGVGRPVEGLELAAGSGDDEFNGLVSAIREQTGL